MRDPADDLNEIEAAFVQLFYRDMMMEHLRMELEKEPEHRCWSLDLDLSTL